MPSYTGFNRRFRKPTAVQLDLFGSDAVQAYLPKKAGHRKSVEFKQAASKRRKLGR